MRVSIVSSLVAATLISTSAMSQVPTYVEASPDLGPQLQIAFPGAGDYDLYESGVILELQFRDWVSEPWGYLLAIGYGEWQADDGATKPGADLYDFDGDIEIVPFGASLLYKIHESDEFSVVLEAGVRYFATDSKITARNSGQSPDIQYDVSIDDSIVGRLGVSADYVLNEDFILSGGIAYQHDIEEGDLSTELGPGEDNRFESFVIDIAIRMPL